MEPIAENIHTNLSITYKVSEANIIVTTRDSAKHDHFERTFKLCFILIGFKLCSKDKNIQTMFYLSRVETVLQGWNKACFIHALIQITTHMTSKTPTLKTSSRRLEQIWSGPRRTSQELAFRS